MIDWKPDASTNLKKNTKLSLQDMDVWGHTGDCSLLPCGTHFQVGCHSDKELTLSSLCPHKFTSKIVGSDLHISGEVESMCSEETQSD